MGSASAPDFIPLAALDERRSAPDFIPLEAAQRLSWADVPGQAVRNAPSSAGHLVSNIAHAVMHPVDTVTGLADLGAGAVREGARRVLPESVFNAIDATGTPETNQRIEKAATGVGHMLADRYGGAENIKRTLATDPVGALADVSAVLTGGGGLVARAPGMVGRAGAAVQTAGAAVDPIMAAARAAGLSGRAVADLVGTTTGAGARPMREAYTAGQTGSQAFLENMRGQRPVDEVVDMADRAVGQMGRERSAAYDANMAGVRASQQPMNFQPVVAALDQARDLAVYRSPSGQTIVRDQAALEAHTRISNLVNEFMNLPPVERTPAAFDALKQSIGDIRQRAQQGTTERAIADRLYRTVRDEITAQVPEYAAAMRDYAAASDAIGEMRRTMSVNDKASTDTTLRKLQSTMRNNVNTNYGQRERLLDTLAQHEPNLPPALAGQALNTWAPRGLARLGITNALVGGAAYMNPMTLMSLPFQSPRLMGEAAYASGRVDGAIRRAAQRAHVTPGVIENALWTGYGLNALGQPQP